MNYLLVLLCRVGSSTIWCLWQPLFIQGKECGVARIILQQLSGQITKYISGLVINYNSSVWSIYQLLH